MNINEVAQWVIDNRYPKSEFEKLSDHELYHGLIEKIELILQQNNGKPLVSGSLPPLDNETIAVPIQDALYATGKFTTDDCSTLADGILQYIKDAKMSIVGGNDH